jgi:hypothetical protein
MTSVGFEQTISAGERPQTLALDRAVAGNAVLINTYYYSSERNAYLKKILEK